MASYAWLGATNNPATTTNWLKDDGTSAEIPVDGSHIILDGRAQNDLAGSDQATIEPASITITSDFTKKVGTYSGATVTFWQIGPAKLNIGEPRADGSFGSGSPGIAINLTTDTAAIRVLSTATTGTAGFAPVLLKGTFSQNTFQVFDGWVQVGMYAPNESSTLASASILGPNAILELGGGVTLTTLHQTDGNLVFRSNVTTFNQEGGKARSEGTGTITTADIGGEFVSNSTGTITNCNVQNAGVLILNQSNAARTITTPIIYGTGVIEMPVPYSAVTFTNNVDCLRGAKSEQIKGAVDVTVAFSAP